MKGIKLFFLHLMLEIGRKKVRKRPPWQGKRFFVPRDNQKQVEVFLHMPAKKNDGALPVMFNIHGGAWVGGDATVLDEQSQKMADLLHCFVVNINYTKVDAKPFPNPQHEVAETVLYFADHAEEYGLDKERFNLIGYSAGGHICAGAAMLLRDRGFRLCSHVMVYPFLDFHLFDKSGGMPGMDDKTINLMNTVFFRGNINRYSALLSPGCAERSELTGLPPAELILCGPDALYQQGLDYEAHLREAGVPAKLKVFELSTHGFAETDYNRELTDEEQIQKAECDKFFLYLKERMWSLWRWEEK